MTDTGPRPRNKLREQWLKRQVDRYVKRCGPALFSRSTKMTSLAAAIEVKKFIAHILRDVDESEHKLVLLQVRYHVNGLLRTEHDTQPDVVLVPPEWGESP